MSIRPDVSVIIASYRAKKSIGATLDSLKHQTMTGRFEAIVVDSSDDDTADGIARSFPDVRLVRFRERKFAGGARNAGIAAAEGRIIAFLDADCVADENWIARVIAAHEEGYAAVGGAIRNGRPGMVGWGAYFCEFSQWKPSRSKRRLADMAGANLSYKADVFKKCGLFIEGTYCSDTEFHWRLLAGGERILFDPSMVVYHHGIDRLVPYVRHEVFHGKCFARVRQKARKFSRFRSVLYALLSPLIFGELVLKNLWFNVRFPSCFGKYICAFPMTVTGIAAWTLGECIGYVEGARGLVSDEIKY